MEYWQTLRGDRLIPYRAEIHPAPLLPYLKHVGLFEVRSPDLTYCRLAGTIFRETLGFELTGRNVVHIYAPSLHHAAGYRFFMMVTRPCAATFELPLTLESGAEHAYEILVLPVAPDDREAPPMLLVGIAPINPVSWHNTAILPQLRASPTFRFVDIGAGIPASSLPPKGIQ